MGSIMKMGPDLYRKAPAFSGDTHDASCGDMASESAICRQQAQGKREDVSSDDHDLHAERALLLSGCGIFTVDKASQQEEKAGCANKPASVESRKASVV
jgi:hypothetical protein